MTPLDPQLVSSSIDWLPHLPAHWKVRRLKHLFMRQQRPPREEDETVTAFRDGQVALRAKRRTEGFTNSLQEIGYQGIRKGDLVIHAMDAFAGAIGVSEDDGKCTPVYSVCLPRSSDVNPRYYSAVLRHMALSGFVNALARGIRERSTEFRWSDAGEVRLPVPPANEQTAIVAFLDRETGKIDALVEEQKRLIELLKEKRQAVISHVVTKGLDPNARMKPSGLEWLGDVPEHWRIVAVKRVSSLITSGPRGWSDHLTEEGHVFFQSQNIGRNMEVVIDDAKRILPDDDAESQRAALSIGDVVVCITGARTGAVAHVPQLPEPAYVNQHVCLVRPKGLKGRFMAYSLTSTVGQQQLQVAMYGLKQGLSLEDVRETVLLLPPEAEQDQLTAWLDVQTATIDALVGEAEKQLALLAERRSALISAAVTGKIDVRYVAAQEEAA